MIWAAPDHVQVTFFEGALVFDYCKAPQVPLHFDAVISDQLIRESRP